MPSSPLRWLLIPAVFLAATLVYLPAITGDFFFDDILNIVDEGSVKIPNLSLPYLLEAAFPLDLGSGIRPVSRLSFALNYYASGMNPAAFKLVNMVLHGLNAVLVFLFLHRLLGMFQTNRPEALLPPPLLLATIAALLWAATPIHANTVPYIVQRMVLLCVTFSLLSLIAYLRLRLAIASRHRWAALGWLSLAGMSALLEVLIILNNKKQRIGHFIKMGYVQR